MTKLQSKTTKVTTKPADDESSSEDTSDEEEPVKPAKPVGKVSTAYSILEYFISEYCLAYVCVCVCLCV